MKGRRGAGHRRRGAAVGLLLLSGAAGADLAFDGSLGPVETLSGDMIVDPSFGTLAGANLFHSFERLSVESGESLHFAADALLVENIIGRVTGVDATFLDGPVSADANLFVVNPNGVILGAGASFDPSVIIEFAAADTVFFDDGDVFRVRDTDAAATLSIAAPDDFGFVSIATDDTLAPSRVLLDDEQGLALIDADAGMRAGTNLFLSFEAFALYPEQAALFLLEADVEHVVARVTSLEDSLFNGVLTLLDETTFEVADSALWFTNPNGLLVGPGVFLDGVPALHLGVADAVAFADGTRFGASGPEPLPTDASPVAFETGAAHGALTVSGALLDPERSLTLAAPDISILDAQLESPELHLEASGGEGRLAIVGASLEALPGEAGEAPRLAIIGERLVRIVESEVTAPSGELEVIAPEIEIDSALLDASSATPDEQAGILRLEGSDILVTEGTLLAARSDGGDAGLVTLSAEVALRVEAGSSIDVSSRGAGRAGEIELSAPIVEVAESALLADSAPGFGLGLAAAAAGFSDALGTDLPAEDPTALVDALRPILADGFGLDLFADTPAGLVAELEAGVDPLDLADFEDALPFFLADFAQLAPDDVGGAGVIAVLGDSVSLSDVVLSTDSFASAVTEPSVILLEARDALTLTGVQAQADTAGLADAGTIVGIGDTIRISDSELRTLALPESSGDAGLVQLLGRSIEISDDAAITSLALNDGGLSGAVLLDASEDISIDASAILTSVLGAGDAGLLSIGAPEVRIEASVLASTSEAVDALATDTGAAGNLEIRGDHVEVRGSTLSTTTAADTADPSSLVLEATDSLLIEGSEISADTVGAAAAGDVVLRGADVAILDSQLFA